MLERDAAQRRDDADLDAIEAALRHRAEARWRVSGGFRRLPSTKVPGAGCAESNQGATIRSDQ